jgi:hypothetical protein
MNSCISSGMLSLPMRFLSCLVAVSALALLGLGCGGGSGGGGETSSASTSGQGTVAAGSAPESPTTGKSGKGSGGQGGGKVAEQAGDTQEHDDSGGGAAQFETKGGDNSIQQFGSEAAGSELQLAAAALHGYLDARAAGEWARACSYMGRGVTRSLSQLASAQGGKGGSCPKIIAGLSSAIPPAVRRETARADVGALRVEGDNAFLLFRGAHDTNYFMPMAHEGSRWGVAAVAPSALS